MSEIKKMYKTIMDDHFPEKMEISFVDEQGRQTLFYEKAAWVIGGKKPGVMTRVAKWAFATPDEARAFIKVNGGKLGNFDDALKVTFEDMYTDTKMIRAKKAKMKKMMKGKMPMQGMQHQQMQHQHK